jgi:alpha-beta hydrolase superfamily lysophospholipase
MRRLAAKILGRIALVVIASLVTLLAVRAWEVSRAPPLLSWHKEVPDDLAARDIDRIDWQGWITAEAALFDAVDASIPEDLPPRYGVPSNRYSINSPMHRSRRNEDWNRSFVLEPDGPARGAVVLLHGLTDAPYSMRHTARHYQALGFLAIGVRLPGHGTVPAGLTGSNREDWRAATRLAVREARARVPEGPLHLVGYSTGAALALAHALDAIDQPALGQPSQIVLISPMVGVTAMARFAGVLGWPAVFPAFARAAWVDIRPEFNPYKYNSFPVHAARESSLLSRDVQAALLGRADDGSIARLPPVLAFQSTIDATVSTPAVVDALFGLLPANGSELVLFDFDRREALAPLMRAGNATPESLLRPAPRPYTVCIHSNAGRADLQVVETCTPANSTEERLRETGRWFPKEVYSLSHVALPFPIHDGLYGLTPDPADIPGISLGATVARGERGMLVVPPGDFSRLTSNPFFDSILERLGLLPGLSIPDQPVEELSGSENNSSAITSASSRPVAAG